MWLKRVYQIARRYLPAKVKRGLKQFSRMPPPATQLVLPGGSVEGALRIWTEDLQLRQTVERSGCADRHAPRASVIVLTHDKQPVTRLCLESLYRNTQCPHFELVVVDNASQDGTRAYLEGLERVVPNLRVILNTRNEGFARANNQGVLHSLGDYVVLLNNDTVVTKGWLSRLIERLDRDSRIGMVGPVTNSAGNEQMIPARYTSLEELDAFAESRSREYEGRFFEINMLGMFCVAFRRRVLDEVGLLDEQFGVGTFEDDDFCHRVKSLGYKLICAEDVFVHHFGKTTMGALGDRGYLKLFEHNRKMFERKWGVRWRPHRLR